jgi:hypothetical protein
MSQKRIRQTDCTSLGKTYLTEKADFACIDSERKIADILPEPLSRYNTKNGHSNFFIKLRNL